MFKEFLFVFFLINLSTCYARVPPRNLETEEKPADYEGSIDKESPIQIPVERSPIDSTINNENLDDKSRTNRKPPIGVILFRTQPSFSMFRDRSPFSPPTIHPLGHSHFSNFGSPSHDDPALRLFSLLFGNRRFRPIQAESAPETEFINESGESSELDRRNPFEDLFPSIFVPRMHEFDKEASETPKKNDEKAPDNFENKEKKVITIGDKKFVKTTQVKKVKNDFGSFHSVISSYQPFDEKMHDENGNDKVKPEESDILVNKKEVEPTVSNESSSTTAKSVTEKEIEKVDSSTNQPEREESTGKPESSSPKPNEKLVIAENLIKDVSKNEISDKNVEIKVDQMN